MDSLVANYASSDEEEEEQRKIPNTKPSSASSSSGFSSLPTPKSQQPKRVVQFKPPINPYALKSHEDDDDDIADQNNENDRKRSRDSSTSSSSGKSLLSMMPAPRTSVSLGAGALPSSGRRALILTEPDTKPSEPEPEPEPEPNGEADHAPFHSHPDYESGIDPNAGNYPYYESYSSDFAQSEAVLGVGDGYGYGSYGGYGHHGAETAVLENNPGLSDGRKRGRREIPKEIVEVKQDELIKNRPREDQLKLTGIAFGPSYQPASTKGKPSKLHKRKHQIGSLFFDMKQKEMELSERRARGMLTKAETHAKYGW